VVVDVELAAGEVVLPQVVAVVRGVEEVRRARAAVAQRSCTRPEVTSSVFRVKIV
jgi:hypothetical protein